MHSQISFDKIKKFITTAEKTLTGMSLMKMFSKAVIKTDIHQSDLNSVSGIYLRLLINVPQIKNKYLIAKNLQLHEQGAS